MSEVHIYLHVDSGAVDRKLDRILLHLQAVEHEDKIMSKELDELTAQVAANTAVQMSAVELINGIAARIEAAGTDPAKLAALTANLRNDDEQLAAAVLANTPAAPPSV